MQRKSRESEYRARLQKLALALGRFGLVDQFGLANLFKSVAPPSHEQVRASINRYSELVPSGLTADIIASSIISEIITPHGDEAVDAFDIAVLATIKPGRKFAGVYHNLIFQILSASLQNDLENPVKEQPLNNDLKRIDIIFDNVATQGFFADLGRKHSIPSLFVPFECKNYSADPGNPEFDQITGRLTPHRGMFGCIVCRRIEDSKRALQRCNKIMTEQQKYIVTLDDGDIREIARAYRVNEQSSIDAVFREKLRELLFS